MLVSAQVGAIGVKMREKGVKTREISHSFVPKTILETFMKKFGHILASSRPILTILVLI